MSASSSASKCPDLANNGARCLRLIDTLIGAMPARIDIQ
jgi:hypothetical protein